MLVVVRAKVTKTRAGAASATYRNMIVCVCVDANLWKGGYSQRLRRRPDANAV